MTEDTVLETLKKIQTDLAVVKRQGAGHTRLLSELMTKVTMIEASMKDVAELNVSSGEIGELHDNVNRVRQELAELQARVEELESQRD